MAPLFTKFRQVLEHIGSASGHHRSKAVAITRTAQVELNRLERELGSILDDFARELAMVSNGGLKDVSVGRICSSAWLSAEDRLNQVVDRLQGLRASLRHAEEQLLQLARAEDQVRAEVATVVSGLEATLHTESLLGVRLLEAQEEERRRLAQRLHDGPMQSLASTALWVQADGGLERYREDIRHRLADILRELRNLVFELRPPMLDDLGLVPALRRYLEDWSCAHRRSAKLRLAGLEARLSGAAAVAVFRGIQEALENVIKHAEADHVDVTLVWGTDFLTVDISDDGCGIGEVNWRRWLESGRLGLSRCRRQLVHLGGALHVCPRKPSGTRVVIQLPIARG
ncbi:MAG: hypothetical protein IRZ33_07035 [Alicyclobacillaceae bacterium]|nr:hypothetical protein [Alicyclobacillaceae bacterium]